MKTCNFQVHGLNQKVTLIYLIAANIDDTGCDCSGCSGELLDVDPNSIDAGSIFYAQDILYCYLTQYQEAWGCQ